MIQVDISNIWGQVSLPELLALEADIAAAHMALTEAHDGAGEQPGLPVLPADESLEAIQAAALRIREASDVLVVIGADCACLGARAAIELLQGQNRNLVRSEGDPQIFFAGNSLSTRQWNQLCRLLEDKDYSLLAISGGDIPLESAITFRNLRWMLERKYGTDQARSRIYAVSHPGALCQMAQEEGWTYFPLPAGVSADFTVLTAAGLLPMAAAGLDIAAVLQGASQAEQATQLRSFENPLWLYAAVRNLLHRKGAAVELLACFEPGFQALGRWWQQLFAGSEGGGLFPAAAQYPADLYSLGRQIQEGRGKLLETLLRFDPPQEKMIVGADVRDLDGLNFIAGEYLDRVEEQACLDVLERHAEGAAVICMDCGPLCEETLGQLFSFFQLSCAVSACTLGADPFCRSCGELYGENTRSLLGRPLPEDI